MAFRGVLQRPESTGERFLREFSNFGSTIHTLGKERKEEQFAKEKLGIEAAKQRASSELLRSLLGEEGSTEEKAGPEQELQKFKALSPKQETALAITNPPAFNAYKNLKDSYEKGEEKAGKRDEKVIGYEVGLGTIDSMKKLIPKLGFENAFSSFLPWTEEAAAVQQYRTYANSLLGILSTIPVRNQKEFESVKEALSSPRASKAQIQAGIEAAEDILRRQLEAHGGGEKEKPSERSSQISKEKKVQFNPSNPEHIAKMKQLEKLHQGDRSKVNRDLAREFE